MTTRLARLQTHTQQRSASTTQERLHALTLQRIRQATAAVPPPPLQPTPAIACAPDTPVETLWAIARNHPELRRWIVSNPNADADLLEYISQQGGPHVRRSLDILLASLA